MSKIIECQVNDEYVLGSGVVIGAAGSYGDVILRLKFNEMWDGLAIMATFRDALNKSPVVEMLVPTMLVDGEVRTYEVPVPAEAKQIAGRARLTLTGYSIYTIEDNGTITPYKDSLTNTSTAFFRVLESDAAVADDGSIGVSPTPTLAEQALTALTDAAKLLAEAEETNETTAKLLAKAEEAENTRKLNENARKANELFREKTEGNRANAEAARANAENERVSAETARANAENERVNAEAARANAENERVNAENERVNAEAERNAKMVEVEALVGDIDTALDSIIAIQNSLIGGDA